LSRGRTPYLFNDNEWVMNRFCLFSINITDSDANKGVMYIEFKRG